MSETLTCAFGSQWGEKGCGPCPKCQAYGDELEADFWREVFFGRWDADGYTPEDRKAQQRKSGKVSA